MEIDPNHGPLPEPPAATNEEPLDESMQNIIPRPPFPVATMDSEIPKSVLGNQIDQELPLTSHSQRVSEKFKLLNDQEVEVQPAPPIPEKFHGLEFRPEEKELKPNVTSAFSIPDILQMLEKSAPESTLHNLRQLSSGFYENFSSTYWDRLNKTIGIDYKTDTDTSTILFVTVDKKDEKELTSIGGIMDWDTLSHTLRTLELWNDWAPRYTEDKNMILNGPGTNNVIAKVSPHITKLEMEFPIVINPGSSTQLIASEFLSGFLKLTNLKLNVRVTEATDQDTHEKLLQGISGLNPDIKITIDFISMVNVYANAEWKGLLETFGAVDNMPNLRLILRTHFSPQLIRIAEGFKSGISKPKLKIYLESSVRNLEELKVFTKFVIQHQDITESSQITLDWSSGLLSLNANDELEIVQCLLDLSPFVSKMLINDIWPYAASQSRNVLNFDTEWSKLVDLTIIGYTYPLWKILQNAPKLKMLHLFVDQKESLFMPSNPQLTETDRIKLKEIFGGLKGLNYFFLDMVCKKCDEEICTSRELEGFLKDILGFPERFNIIVRTHHPSDFDDSESSESDDNASSESEDSEFSESEASESSESEASESSESEDSESSGSDSDIGGA